jgi:hypothetical protein
MMPSPPTHGRPATCYFARLAASRAQARIGPLRSLSVAPPTVSPTIRVALALPRAHPTSTVSRSWQRLRPAIRKHHPLAKSP